MRVRRVKMKKYTDEEILSWYDEYLKVKSVFKVSDVFDASPATIWRKLKAFEVDKGLSNLSRFKYSCDEDFFSKDIPESFYWAGFIAADGNLYNTGYNIRLSIKLSTKDIDMLYKFKKCIKYTGPVYSTSQKRNETMTYGSYIQIHSHKIAKSLSRFNIAPKKSLTYVFPEWLITHPLVNHFMRGYNDGDGGFSYSNKCLYISVCGTNEFLRVFRNILINRCHLKRNKIYKHGIISLISYGGNKNLSSISKFLYSNINDTIYMKRKYDIIKHFVNEV